jgi:hypothetical protein
VQNGAALRYQHWNVRMLLAPLLPLIKIGVLPPSLDEPPPTFVFVPGGDRAAGAAQSLAEDRSRTAGALARALEVECWAVRPRRAQAEQELRQLDPVPHRAERHLRQSDVD